MLLSRMQNESFVEIPESVTPLIKEQLGLSEETIAADDADVGVQIIHWPMNPNGFMDGHIDGNGLHVCGLSW